MSVSSGTLVVPSPEAVRQGVFAAYEAEGYLKDDGELDQTKVRARIFEIVSQHKVLNKKERNDKSITKGDLTAEVFPNLPGPDEIKEIEDDNARDFAERIYDKIERDWVWAAVKTDATGPVQQLVESNMGNGYVLCRTQKGKDKVDAVYVTDDFACIKDDYTRPENLALERKIRSITRNRQMLIRRQSEHGEKLIAEFKGVLRGQLTSGVDQLQLTLESVSNFDGHEPEDEPGNGESGGTE